MHTLKDASKILRAIANILDWEKEVIVDVHRYAHEFGCTPGGNVFEFLLRDALRLRKISLESLREKRPLE